MLFFHLGWGLWGNWCEAPETNHCVSSEWQELAIQDRGQLQGNAEVAPTKGRELHNTIKSCCMPSDTPNSCWVLEESYRARPLGMLSCAFMRRLKDGVAIEWPRQIWCMFWRLTEFQEGRCPCILCSCKDEEGLRWECSSAATLQIHPRFWHSLV